MLGYLEGVERIELVSVILRAVTHPPDHLTHQLPLVGPGFHRANEVANHVGNRPTRAFRGACPVVIAELLEEFDQRGVRGQRHVARVCVEAAWSLSRTHGLNGWSLRDLAAAVGMRAPSLYVYFDSKNAIFDTMFREGYQQLLDEAAGLAPPADPRDALRRLGRRFFAFAIADQARMQLMFWRVVPGFEPSSDAYEVSRKVSEFTLGELQRIGIEDPDAPEVWMVLTIGLVTQQVANESSGDSWGRHVDAVVDMYADKYLKT